MNRRDFNKSMLAGASLIAAPAIARADTVYNLKLGHFISPTHIFAKYLENWVAELKEKSNGRLIITIFPANEMGPVQNYADYARTGVADITWFLHGATPGRFPLTEIVQRLGSRGVNVHFEDVLIDGKMTFDYRIRPGVELDS